MNEEIELLKQQIQKLKKERDNNPQYPIQWVESIQDDINYYQKKIDYLQDQ